MHKITFLFLFSFSLLAGEVELIKKVEIPPSLLTQNSGISYGGDIRIGDLNGDGSPDFVVYRSIGDFHDGGGMKPCFIGAFDINGKELWKVGGGGQQPSRQLCILPLAGEKFSRRYTELLIPGKLMKL